MDPFIPESGGVDILFPILIEVVSEELIHLGRYPGGGMHSVSNGANRDLIHVQARPQELPHFACNHAMQFTDTIVMICELEGKDCHTIGRAPAVIFTGNF